MAYQNVGTPRFYINVLEWIDSVGNIAIDKIFRTLPVDVKTRSGGLNMDYPVPSGVLGGKSFTAILGHNMPIPGVVEGWGVLGSGVVQGTGDDTIEVNVSSSGVPVKNGFSILDQSFEGHTSVGIYFSGGADVGSVIVGTYYDMPHSPDLNLTMTRDYSGIKHIETKGGASLSNSFYTKPPAWGDLGAWEIGNYPESVKLGASGRRIWDLSFSYLDDGDVFGSNQHIGMAVWTGMVDIDAHEGDDIDSNTSSFNKNILTDDNFYSQVIHKTNGGQLPFIFQPNAPRLNASTGEYEGGDNTQFAICKFDMKSFKFEQVANGVYNMKLKIREVW